MIDFDDRFPPVVAAPVDRLRDGRGSLTKVFANGAFGASGFQIEARQILYSMTDSPGVLRGLHAQLPPFSEAKILVPLAGRVYWVIVDLRAGSQSFARWQGFELSPEGASGAGALQVPAGFAHGCLSLEAGSGLLILADQEHAPGHGVGVAWDDPELAINWPLDGKPVLSKEHEAYGSLAEFCDRYGGL